MDISGWLPALLVGLLMGAGSCWLVLRARAVAAGAQLLAERDVLRREVVRLQTASEESQELAMTLAPLNSSMARVERQVEQLERERATQWGKLDAQLTGLASSDEVLRRQTAELAGALRSGGVRGSWGEVQLRRVVEHAGMLEKVDFRTQVNGVNDDGAAVCPDAVICLPGGKHIVLDAKAPLGEDDSAQARLLKGHVQSLAGKRYWTAFDPSPELVVCFVPSEGLLAAACRADPALLEFAMGKRVVIATPTTLLAMLRTVALTWQQDTLVGNAQQVVQLGRQLHERLVEMSGGTAKLGRTLTRAVLDYNALVSTTERQVLARARELGGLGVTTVAVPEPARVQVEVAEPLAAMLNGSPSNPSAAHGAERT